MNDNQIESLFENICGIASELSETNKQLKRIADCLVQIYLLEESTQ